MNGRRQSKMENENGTNGTKNKEVELIPHPDGMDYPNTTHLMITTKPSKNSTVKYEVFERKPELPKEVTDQPWEHGMTIGNLIENGMRNVSYRANFSSVFEKATNPEDLTEDEHRALQTCLENYMAGVRGTSKAEKQAKMEQSITEKVMAQLGMTPEQFAKAVAKANK